jgi:hypothetical protein
MTSIMDGAAHLTDTPLRQIRDLIDQIVAETDTIPDHLARGEPITITLTLNLTVDDEAVKHLDLEMKRAQQKLKGP